MAELVAEGSDPKNPRQTWKYQLTALPIKLGRKAPESDWACDWDARISRFHATLTWREGRLFVQRNSSALNPIYCRGQIVDSFDIGVGEQFVIGGTTFTLVEPPPPPVERELATPISELTCSRQELEQIPYTEAETRIKVLSALPSMIRTSTGDEQLETQVLDAVLRGIPRALIAAVVRLDTDSPSEEPKIEVRSALDRNGVRPELTPSRRLVVDAVRRKRQSVIHRWGSGLSPDSGFKTIGAGNWALCAPLPDEPTPGYALYASGKIYEDRLVDGPDIDDIYKSDLKFAELVADIFGALRSVAICKAAKPC